MWVFFWRRRCGQARLQEPQQPQPFSTPRSPTFDNDGETEIVLVHNKVGTKKTHSGVTVIGDATNRGTCSCLWVTCVFHHAMFGDDGCYPGERGYRTLYKYFWAGITGPADGLKAPDLVVEIVKCEAYLCHMQVFWIPPRQRGRLAPGGRREHLGITGSEGRR